MGQNIARNTALSENVFMMAICTELRIPLFVVGKPGSSKSLAKDVISTNMKGGNSQSDLFKNLKQVLKSLVLHRSILTHCKFNAAVMSKKRLTPIINIRGH